MIICILRSYIRFFLNTWKRKKKTVFNNFCIGSDFLVDQTASTNQRSQASSPEAVQRFLVVLCRHGFCCGRFRWGQPCIAGCDKVTESCLDWFRFHSQRWKSPYLNVCDEMMNCSGFLWSMQGFGQRNGMKVSVRLPPSRLFWHFPVENRFALSCSTTLPWKMTQSQR